jgi:hypothetical protein
MGKTTQKKSGYSLNFSTIFSHFLPFLINGKKTAKNKAIIA